MVAMATSRSNMLSTRCLDEPHPLSNLHSFQSPRQSTPLMERYVKLLARRA